MPRCYTGMQNSVSEMINDIAARNSPVLIYFMLFFCFCGIVSVQFAIFTGVIWATLRSIRVALCQSGEERYTRAEEK